MDRKTEKIDAMIQANCPWPINSSYANATTGAAAIT